jgi:integrase
MALEIQRGRSQWWYGRVTVNGKDYTRNLGVKIEGRIPASLRNLGDARFERSRAQAQAALDKFSEELRRKSTAEELIQTIHEIRTGGRIGSLPLNEFFERWKEIPRRKPPSDRYVAVVEGMAKRFVSFLNANHKAVKELGDVQASMAKAFMRAEEKRGISEKTYNNVLIFLRSAFEGLRKEAGCPENPFDGIPTKEEHTIHRKPFTTDELALIVDEAKKDDFIGPVIITGASTAMRRGDCCLLSWDSIDLKDRFISVATSKTSETVRIPIFPLFEETLLTAQAKAEKAKKKSKYVFPEQAMMYRSNPDGITYRVREIFARAGFHDAEDLKENTASRGKVRQARKQGLRKASIRDFHSLRVTWVTVALSAGVPIEIVQKVTGHRTASIVQKHYFQPGKEDFRRALAEKLPALVGGPSEEKISAEGIRTRLNKMSARNWRAIRSELLAHLDRS